MDNKYTNSSLKNQLANKEPQKVQVTPQRKMDGLSPNMIFHL